MISLLAATQGRASRVAAALAGALVLASASLVGLPARAASDSEEALRTWLADMGESSRWHVNFKDIDGGPGGDDARVTGLTIISAPAGLTIRVPEMILSGQVTTDRGRLQAGNIAAAAATITTKGVRVEFEGIDMAGGQLPNLRRFYWSPREPLGTMARVYGLLADFGMDEGSVGAVRLIEFGDEIESVITYGDLALSDWADGRIADVTIGPMRMEAPSPDGIVRFSVGSFQGNDIDLGAFAHAFDPDRYTAGRGDGKWKTAIGRAHYDAVAIDAPDMAITINEVLAEAVRLRQSRRSFLDYADRAMIDPELLDEASDLMNRTYDGFSSFAIGRFTIDGVSVEAQGFDELTMRRFILADVSTEAVGELSVEGVKASVPGEGYFDLDRFALGDLVLPTRQAVTRAISGEGAATDLTAQLGTMDVVGLDFQSFGQPRAQLERLHMVLRDYVGRIPSTIDLDVTGLQFGVDLIDDRSARDLMEALGYEEIDADFGFEFAWDPARRTVTLDDVHFTMRDLGTVRGEARFEGLLSDTFDDLAALEDKLETVEFAGGRMTFRDDSIVTRSLAMQAARMQVETEVFREQIAGALPFMISFLGTPEFQRKIVPVLQAFIRKPGDLTIASDPEDPITLSALETALRGAPQSLPDLLAVTVTDDATAGIIGGDLRPAIPADE